MRRALLVSLAFILGLASLLWAYLAIDIDPDDQSPKVEVTSYQGLFEEAVRRTARKEYGRLDQAARRNVLARLAGARSNPVVREVALAHLRDLTDQGVALAIIKKELSTTTDEQYEAAIGAAESMNSQASKSFLETVWRELDARAASHTPLGDYRYGTLIASKAAPDIEIEFQERSRVGADYSTSSVAEISLFLPDRPDYVVGIPNIDDVLGDFYSSRFVAALDGSPVPNDVWSLPLLRTVATLRSRLDETLGMLAPYFAPERFFKDQFLLAKYDQNYLVACYKDKNLTVAEGLLTSFGKHARDFGVSTWNAEGEAIHTIRNRKSGRTLSYAVVGPYFVTSTDSILIGKAVRTYVSDRSSSFAIDPLFASTYGAIDQSGRRQVLYAWVSPSKVFNVIGSSDPSARRKAIVARALGRRLYPADIGTEVSRVAQRMEGAGLTFTLAGSEPASLWRYVATVRSLGNTHLDSLARVSGMDIARDLVPYLGSSVAIRFTGIDHLSQPYGFSNTSYHVALAMPLSSNAPQDFGFTLARFLGRVTSLRYTSTDIPDVRGTMWTGADTATTDSATLTEMLRPAFAIVNERTLVIASTPDELRSAITAILPAGGEPAPVPAVSRGSLRANILAGNVFGYATSYLLRTDRFLPEEISTRLLPLRNAFSTIESFNWMVVERDGLRHGTGVVRNRR